jgi:hypothetical protein
MSVNHPDIQNFIGYLQSIAKESLVTTKKEAIQLLLTAIHLMLNENSSHHNAGLLLQSILPFFKNLEVKNVLQEELMKTIWSQMDNTAISNQRKVHD